MEYQRITGRRILLVDDVAEARRLLNLLLSFDQHVVTEAANGREACLLYAPGDFDLVITDYDMPVMKGDELAKAIKCLVPTQRVIMITGSESMTAGPNNPVDAVVMKPVTLEEMRRCIAGVMSQASKQAPFRWLNSKPVKSIGLGHA